MPYTDAQIDTMLAGKFNASYADSFWLMVCGFFVFFWASFDVREALPSITSRASLSWLRSDSRTRYAPGRSGTVAGISAMSLVTRALAALVTI